MSKAPMTAAAREKASAIYTEHARGLTREEFIDALGTAAGAYIDMNWPAPEREAAVNRLLDSIHAIIGNGS